MLQDKEQESIVEFRVVMNLYCTVRETMIWLVFSLVNDKITLNFTDDQQQSSNVRWLNRLSEFLRFLAVVCLDITQRVNTVPTIMDVDDTSTSFWWLRAGQLGTMWHSTGTQFGTTEADHPNLKLQQNLDSTLPSIYVSSSQGWSWSNIEQYFGIKDSLLLCISLYPRQSSSPAFSTKHPLN
jgi:hypothetical protein